MRAAPSRGGMPRHEFADRELRTPRKRVRGSAAIGCTTEASFPIAENPDERLSSAVLRDSAGALEVLNPR
jgi:hypothetical protein